VTPAGGPGPLDAGTLESLLDHWPVARLATVRPHGRPHLVPVVFVRCLGALWTPVDAKPKTGALLVRERNVRAEPRVGLLLDHYDPDWSRLWWVRVDGRATLARGPAAEPPLSAVAAALRAKYPEYARTAPFREGPEAGARALRIEVERVRSWCAGPAARDAAARA
jgi:PPOX class probable F420-dependent enzyme